MCVCVCVCACMKSGKIIVVTREWGIGAGRMRGRGSIIFI